jgi:hypothetical protein
VDELEEFDEEFDESEFGVWLGGGGVVLGWPGTGRVEGWGLSGKFCAREIGASAKSRTSETVKIESQGPTCSFIFMGYEWASASPTVIRWPLLSWKLQSDCARVPCVTCI